MKIQGKFMSMEGLSSYLGLWKQSDTCAWSRLVWGETGCGQWVDGCVPKLMSAFEWKKVAPIHWAFIEHLVYTWSLWGYCRDTGSAFEEFARARMPYSDDSSQVSAFGWWHKTLFTFAAMVHHALSLWISHLCRPRMRPSPQGCDLCTSQSNRLASITPPNTHSHHHVSHMRKSQLGMESF